MGVLDLSTGRRVVLIGLQGGESRFGRYRRCQDDKAIQGYELLFTGQGTNNERPELKTILLQLKNRILSISSLKVFLASLSCTQVTFVPVSYSSLPQHPATIS